MPTPLSPAETRVLGCLLEKERLTPDLYPLSLHALTAACNQTTSREPVMGLSEKEVERALDELRGRKLATVIFGAGSRVQKYRHNLPDFFNLSPLETALLCVLLLRGPQTPGELRARTERLAPATGGVNEVEAALETLARGEEPLVRALPARPGQKERRFVQLLSGEPAAADLFTPEPLAPAAPAPPSRLDALEAEMRAVRAELQALREELAGFKRQFE